MFNIKAKGSRLNLLDQEELLNHLNLTPLTAEVLLDYTKMNNIKEAYDYLNQSYDLSKITNPTIDKASSELNDLLFNKKKKVLVLTDYDADGICSAVVSQTLLSLVLPPEQFLVKTNRRKYGNGLNHNLFNEITNLDQYEVIVTADQGSSNEEIFKELKERNPNIKIFLTDHHTFREHNYPKSVDHFINNQLEHYEELPEEERKSWNVFKDSSGCIMVFFLWLHTIKSKVDIKTIYKEVLPFLAITIVSDVMGVDNPLNRYIVRAGLRIINGKTSEVFNAIKVFLRLEPLYSVDTLRYTLSPMINTGNRQHCEELVLNLLIPDTRDSFLSNISELHMKNNERKKLTNEVVTRLVKSNRLDGRDGISIIVKTEMGINGIIAAKIGEIYQKPTVCFLIGEHGYHGSIRGILPGYDVIEILNRINEDGLLKVYGGHKEAAGCVVEAEHIDAFKEKFNLYTKEKLESLPPQDTIEVFRILEPESITINNITNLTKLEPYGKNFPEPLFYSELTVKNKFTSSSMSFLNFKEILHSIQGVAYKSGKYDHDQVFKINEKVGIVFTMRLGYFRGNYQCSINIVNAKNLGVKNG